MVPKMESDDVDAAATAKDENEKKMLEMINAAGVKAFNKEEHGEVPASPRPFSVTMVRGCGPARNAARVIGTRAF